MVWEKILVCKMNFFLHLYVKTVEVSIMIFGIGMSAGGISFMTI